MKRWRNSNRFIGGVILFCGLTAFQPPCFSDPYLLISQSEDPQNREVNKKILVEAFLSSEQRKNRETFKKELEAVSITRVTIQFFRLGHPPQNIAIGRNVPGEIARLAIRLAVTYNQGVKFLLPQYRFSHDYIAIGTSAFDESSQIPIRPEDLEQLSDPDLSTPEFHALYQKLTGEDKKLPTYLE
jgi:hypothetical protein